MGEEKHSQDFVLGQVLYSEKAAEQRILDARSEADDIYRQAQLQERSITARRDKRIQAMYAGSRQRLAQNQTRLAAEFETEQNAPNPRRSSGKVKAAVARLAIQLTEAARK